MSGGAPPLTAMPLFGPFPDRWKDWPVEDRLVAVYGMATSTAEKFIKDAAPNPLPTDKAWIVASLQLLRATVCQVLGKTEEEMDVLSLDVWNARGNTAAAGPN